MFDTCCLEALCGISFGKSTLESNRFGTKKDVQISLKTRTVENTKGPRFIISSPTIPLLNQTEILNVPLELVTLGFCVGHR